MARARIFIEDEGAELAFRIEYVGGANKDSPAHQLANLIRAHLDELSAKGMLVQTKVTDEEVPAILAA